MAEYTQNLNLEKPAENENFRRQILNDNMEKIDKKFGSAGEGHTHDGTAGQGRRVSYSNLEGKPTAMTPTAHKASHATGGSDAITPADIGAETPAGAQMKVNAVKAELHTHLAETTSVSLYRSGKDSNGIYIILEWKRADGTLLRKSILSGGTSPIYTTRTVTYYEADGITVKESRVFTLSYFGQDIVSEVLA